MASVDGIIAIMIFVTFVVWSISFYSGVFVTERAQPLADEVIHVSDNVVDYLSIDVYEVPVRFFSPNNPPDALYMDFAWPSGGARNSTQVLKDGVPVSCNITGNRLFWDADVAPGDNFFTVRYFGRDAAMNCSGGYLGDVLNMTVPWSSVKKQMISGSRASDLAGMDYAALSGTIGDGRELRVEMNVSGSVTVAGKPTPNSSSVYVKTTRHATQSGGEAEIRVLVW